MSLSEVTTPFQWRILFPRKPLPPCVVFSDTHLHWAKGLTCGRSTKKVCHISLKWRSESPLEFLLFDAGGCYAIDPGGCGGLWGVGGAWPRVPRGVERGRKKKGQVNPSPCVVEWRSGCLAQGERQGAITRWTPNHHSWPRTVALLPLGGRPAKRSRSPWATISFKIVMASSTRVTASRGSLGVRIGSPSHPTS